MKLLKIVLILSLSLAFSSQVLSQNKQFGYVGAKGCKTCHNTKKQGRQYKIWLNSKHAQAYKTLASEKAKAIAKEKGIADPQKAGECLQCHVTAYGVDAKLLGKKYSIEEGVSCESCHGPGKVYKKKKTMIAISKGEIDPASVGLIKPDEETCKKCHNEKSPTFKEFDFEKFYEKIKHEKPKKS